MKIASVILLVLTTFTLGNEQEHKPAAVQTTNHYTRFLSAYKHIKKFEGNYSNLEYDPGNETYAGISRHHNKDWIGWGLLDIYKAENGGIKLNEDIPILEEYVIDYYYNIWNTEGYHKIQDQFLANYLFDFRINAGSRIAVKHIIEILNERGFDISDNKKLTDEIISAINKSDPFIMVLKLRDKRMMFYQRIVTKNPRYEKFMKSWTMRTQYINS